MSHIESMSNFQPFTYVPSFNLKDNKAESHRDFAWFCRDLHWTQSRDPPSADPSEYVALQSRRSAKANCHHHNLSSFSTLTSCYPMLIQRRGIGSFAIRYKLLLHQAFNLLCIIRHHMTYVCPNTNPAQLNWQRFLVHRKTWIASTHTVCLCRPHKEAVAWNPSWRAAGVTPTNLGRKPWPRDSDVEGGRFCRKKSTCFLRVISRKLQKIIWWTFWDFFQDIPDYG